MTTFRSSVRAIARVTKTKPRYVDEVGRQLRASDQLPAPGGSGPISARLTAEQVALLVIGVAADLPHGVVARHVATLAALQCSNVNFARTPLDHAPTLSQTLARILTERRWPNAALELDVGRLTASVFNVGDVPLEFGLPASTGDPMQRRTGLAPGALHQLSSTLQN